MPKAQNIKMLAVYATEAQREKLTKAAELEHRSLSNFLLSLGLERADELDVKLKDHGKAKRKARKKK